MLKFLEDRIGSVLVRGRMTWITWTWRAADKITIATSQFTICAELGAADLPRTVFSSRIHKRQITKVMAPILDQETMLMMYQNVSSSMISQPPGSFEREMAATSEDKEQAVSHGRNWDPCAKTLVHPPDSPCSAKSDDDCVRSNRHSHLSTVCSLSCFTIP